MIINIDNNKGKNFGFGFKFINNDKDDQTEKPYVYNIYYD
jgi:hypothetical protein